MTLNEIAYNIKNLSEGGYSTDDSNLDIRQIKSWIHYHRLGLLESYTDNGKKIPSGATQNLGVFTVPDSDSYLTLPRIASLGSTRAISSITSVDGGFVFGRTTQDKIEYQSASRFTSSMPIFYLEEASKVFFRGGDGESVKIIAVLEDPTDLSGYNDDTDDYPMPSQLVGPLVKKIAEVEMNVTTKTPGDLINNNVEADREVQSGGK
tara:strand:- start:13877 stop:14497 length:621 start_codon:yes stop_codon:yes gene_type:complete